MTRISFRQSMLAGFLLIALLLGGAAVRSWMVVERFVDRSREVSAEALLLTGLVQDIAERAPDLERAARQYLILGDPVLLARFDATLSHARGVAERIDTLPGRPLGGLAAEWALAAGHIGDVLRNGATREELGPLLTALDDLGARLGPAGRRWIEARNGEVLAELQENRLQLTGQVIAAVAGAVIVALGMGWWLVRPIQQLERNIHRLGESRLDQPVQVRGPADLRRVGRRLEWLRQRLAELEADRERSLRHVSHELKTPLTALREGITLLQEQVVGPLDPAQQEVADILRHNVVVLQEQIESLLRLNAASFDARRLSYRPQIVRRILAQVVKARELQLQARRISVRRAAPAVTLPLDGEKLQVVVDNLLSNAIDFSPDGGTIRLEAQVDERRLLLDCIDEGPGVAPEDAEKIFDPFVRGVREAPAPRRGSGVGLSIVRELLAAMGGRVALVSEGSGARGAHFRVEIPYEH
ncbi:MAG: HAMP domain-containing protein [Azonexus sp.]|nr:HAMP domain-containing protein [Betaproteobacteria bacterium]MBK8918244.1 HAMP domain-containing protein [Betaproteobacteria bacterium]MBP6036206.1 HAMP domain-containing protein [Azonexus sp.]MBP6906729.1 HAMP domain-containing protein [Azonexus sp.]